MFKLIKQKKSQAIFVNMMVSILALIVIVILVNPLRQEIQKATNGTYSAHLNSSNTSLAPENKATVVVLDLGLFYFIAILIACSLGYITGNKNIVGAVTSIVLFMIINILITPLKSLIILIRDSSHLNCGSATATVGQTLSCIAIDIWLFYFVVVVISVGLSYIFVTKVIKK